VVYGAPLGLEPEGLSSQELLKRVRLKLLDYAHVPLSCWCRATFRAVQYAYVWFRHLPDRHQNRDRTV